MNLQATLYFVMVLRLSSFVKGNVLMEYTLSEYSGVVTLIFRKYHPACIIILHSTPNLLSEIGLYDKWKIIELEKLLLQVNVRITSIRMETYNHTLCQDGAQPLTVISSSTPSVKKKLQAPTWISTLSDAIWLLFLNSNLALHTFFSEINIPFDCKFFVAQSHEEVIELTEIYRVAAGMSLLDGHYGKWSTNGSYITNVTLYERRKSLHGFKMKGVSIQNNPVTTIRYTSKKEITVGGLFGAVWRALQEALNFTTTFQVETTFGALNNGSWNGMIEMLRARTVDVALSEFTITQERMKVVDYVIPIINTKFQVMIKQPMHENLTWSDFLEPFSLWLWLTICFSILVLSFLLSILHSLGRRFGNEEAIGPSRYSFYDSLHYIFGIFCQQGHEFTPRATSCRLVYLTAYLTAVILLAAYSAALISSLTEKTATLPFRDLRGLLKDGTYHLGVLKDSAEFNLFSQSNNTVMQEAFQELILRENDLPESYEEGSKRICNGKYAFVASALAVIGSSVACGVSALPDVAFPVSLSLALTKNNPYKDIFNYNLHILRSEGTLKRMRDKAWTPKLPKVKSPWNTVHLNSIVPVLVVLIAGILLAGVILAMERHLHRVYSLKHHKKVYNCTSLRFSRTPIKYTDSGTLQKLCTK